MICAHRANHFNWISNICDSNENDSQLIGKSVANTFHIELLISDVFSAPRNHNYFQRILIKSTNLRVSRDRFLFFLPRVLNSLVHCRIESTRIEFTQFKVSSNCIHTYRMAKMRIKQAIVGTIVNSATIAMVCMSFQSENRIQIVVDLYWNKKPLLIRIARQTMISEWGISENPGK